MEDSHKENMDNNKKLIIIDVRCDKDDRQLSESINRKEKNNGGTCIIKKRNNVTTNNNNNNNCAIDNRLASLSTLINDNKFFSVLQSIDFAEIRRREFLEKYNRHKEVFKKFKGQKYCCKTNFKI